MHRLLVVTGLLLAWPLSADAQFAEAARAAAQARAASVSPAQALSTCLADSTSGKDRKDLARWIFLAMATHPEIKQYAGATAPAARDEANKTTGALFTRLMADACPTQMKAAAADGGAQAVQSAFATFGQLAMQELMTNADVATAMGAIQQNIDQKKISQALGGQ